MQCDAWLLHTIFQPARSKLAASNDVEIRVQGAAHSYFFIVEAIAIGKSIRFWKRQNIRNYKRYSQGGLYYMMF